MNLLKAPFPYFGGKSKIAPLIWERLGDVPNYVEPFAGSLACLLSRPHPPRIETVNDADGLLCNFWRALKHDPETVAEHANWPVIENDLHARHAWLVGQRESITSRLDGDPDFYDAKAAGWWVWGISCWIGSGWCSGSGPWQVVDGQLVNIGDSGRGVNRQIPHIGGSGRGVEKASALVCWMQELSERLSCTRVCCGDWTRVCGPSVTFKQGMTAVLLDPPYADTADRASNLYASDDLRVAHAVREWAIEQGKNPLMRIALCGYEGEHEMPDDWDCVAWKAQKGYGGQKQSGLNDNSHRERVWFSPACIKPEMELF